MNNCTDLLLFDNKLEIDVAVHYRIDEVVNGLLLSFKVSMNKKGCQACSFLFSKIEIMLLYIVDTATFKPVLKLSSTSSL